MNHDDLHGREKRLLEAAWTRYLAEERLWVLRRRHRRFLGLLRVVVGLMDVVAIGSMAVITERGPWWTVLLGVTFLVPLACWNVRLWWAYRGRE